MMTGGIAGALWLVGLASILTLLISVEGPALPYFGIGHAIENWKHSWSDKRIDVFFVSIGAMGFALGMIAGWRRSAVVQKWFVPTVTYATPIVLCLWLLNNYAGRVAVPCKTKLTDCTNNPVAVQLAVPKGRNYRLVLAAPPGSSNTFSGHARITDGASRATNFSFGNNRAEAQCDFLRAQTSYIIEIQFDQPPLPATSLWLHWLQAVRDTP